MEYLNLINLKKALLYIKNAKLLFSSLKIPTFAR